MEEYSLLECLEKFQRTIERKPGEDNLGAYLSSVKEHIKRVSVIKKYSIPFLDTFIELSELERTDPLALMLISNIEQAELNSQSGFALLCRYRDDYGISFSDVSFYNKIKNALFSR
jgi:hypothetical protein